jgi:hypothetical protein
VAPKPRPGYFAMRFSRCQINIRGHDHLLHQCMAPYERATPLVHQRRPPISPATPKIPPHDVVTYHPPLIPSRPSLVHAAARALLHFMNPRSLYTPYQDRVAKRLRRHLSGQHSTDRLSRTLFFQVADILDTRISRNHQDDQDQVNVAQARYFQESEKQCSTPCAVISFV